MAVSGLGARVQAFVHRKNLDHYRRLLADEPDEAQHVLQLLAEEEATELPPFQARDDN
jgi:hypothetical protein